MPSRYRRHAAVTQVLILTLLVDLAYGQPSPTREELLAGEVYVRQRYVENATGVADESLQVDETQTELGASLASILQTEFTALDLQYDVIDTRYHENSQADDSYWQGQSSLMLGNDNTFYELAATHSIRRVLNSPELSPLVLSNSDSREIFAISPLLRSRLGEANTVSMAYGYSKVRFSDNDSNDSERDGVQLQLTRRITPIRQLSLIVESRAIDYETSDVADYDYFAVAIRFEAELRTFDYAFELGSAEIEPVQGERVSSPRFEFSLNSDVVAGNQFALFATRTVSDSSLGNGNSDFFTTEVSFDTALADRDQVERSSSGLSWSNSQLCRGCSLSVTLGFEQIEYVNLSENDSIQRFNDLNFAYEFSRSITAAASVRMTTTDFDALSTRADTESTVSRAELRYTHNRYLDFVLLVERDERSAEDSDDFSVDTFGMTAILGFD